MSRADRVAARLAEREVDALLVTDLVNVRYLTGFTGTAGMAIVGPETRRFITDFRYVERAKAEVSGFDQRARAAGAGGGAQGGLAGGRAAARLRGPAPQRAPARAAARAAAGPHRARRRRRPGRGRAGAQGAGGGRADPRRRGAHRRDLRVGARARRGRPHRARGRAGARGGDAAAGRERAELPVDRRLRPRTARCRTPSRATSRSRPACSSPSTSGRGSTATAPTARARGRPASSTTTCAEIYDLVLRAQQAALDAVRPGPTGREIDAVARDLIAAEGHGDHFGHGLGHGVGLEVHEAPRLARTGTDALEAGNVVTVEPGVYVPGRGRRADRGSRPDHRKRARCPQRDDQGADHRPLSTQGPAGSRRYRARYDFLRPHSPNPARRRLHGRPVRPHGSRDCGRLRPRPGFRQEEEGEAARRDPRQPDERCRSARHAGDPGQVLPTRPLQNTVVFKRSGGRAVFVKAKLGTKKLLRVTVPKKLEKEFTKGSAASPWPTRFRMRDPDHEARQALHQAQALAAHLLQGRRRRRPAASSPSPTATATTTAQEPIDADDDNDGLTDATEQPEPQPLHGRHRRDGVEDRWEFDCDRNGVLNRDEATMTRTS